MPSCNCWECEAAAAAGYHAASDKSYCEERFPFAPQASVPGHRSDSSVQYAPQSVQCCTHFFVSMLTGGQHEFALSLCTLSPLLPTNQGILRGTRRRPSSALFHLPRSPTMRQVTMRAMRLRRLQCVVADHAACRTEMYRELRAKHCHVKRVLHDAPTTNTPTAMFCYT